MCCYAPWFDGFPRGELSSKGSCVSGLFLDYQPSRRTELETRESAQATHPLKCLTSVDAAIQVDKILIAVARRIKDVGEIISKSWASLRIFTLRTED